MPVFRAPAVARALTSMVMLVACVAPHAACGKALPLGRSLSARSGSVAIAVGRDHACAIVGTRVACWGNNLEGAAGPVSGQIPAMLIPDLDGVRAIVAGRHFNCALHMDSSVSCWGERSNGALGNGSTPVGFGVAARVPGLLARTIFAGGETACAIDLDGNALCWGHNHEGQAAPNDLADAVTSPTLLEGLPKLVALAPGEAHTCVLSSAGEVYCWGSNDEGELGDGTTTSRRTPALVPGLSNVVALSSIDVSPSSARGSTCALTMDQRVLCWGTDDAGQLGDGDLTDGSSIPSPVDLADATHIVVGQRGVIAFSASRGWVSWGANSNGSLGTTPTTNVLLSPTDATMLADMVELDLGFVHACGLDADGRVLCWGSNPFGMIPGIPFGQPQPVPLEIPMPTP